MQRKQRRERLMSDKELADALNHFEAKRAKIEAFELLGLVNPRGRDLAQYAAQDLKGCKNLIFRAANEGRKGFFIQLGKLLEGKRLKPNLWSKLDEDVAFILCYDPKIKSTQAVALLHKAGHPAMTPLAFKQKRYNWRRAAAKTRKRLEQAGWKYQANSFLDALDAEEASETETHDPIS